MDVLNKAHQSIHYLSHDFLGGPRIMNFNWVINLQKGLTFFWVLGLMVYFHHYTTQSWVYLALHGSYGFIWVMKDIVFPDSKWQTKITFGSGLIALLLVLGPYWVAPYLLISPVLGEAHVGATWVGLTVAMFVYILGLAIMVAADTQKYYTLKHQKGLITTGMFRYIRHPNYLGEIMIYASFALVTWHWIPWAILFWVWLGYFSINILMKERSMSRYEAWAEYQKRTWYLVPFIL